MNHFLSLLIFKLLKIGGFELEELEAHYILFLSEKLFWFKIEMLNNPLDSSWIVGGQSSYLGMLCLHPTDLLS